jgi:hypothetical protein
LPLEEVEVLGVAKVAEAIGTIAILLSIIYLFAQGIIVPRTTLRDLMEALEKQYEAALTALQEANKAEHAQLGRSLFDLSQVVKDLAEVTADCKAAQAMLELFSDAPYTREE